VLAGSEEGDGYEPSIGLSVSPGDRLAPAPQLTSPCPRFQLSADDRDFLIAACHHLAHDRGLLVRAIKQFLSERGVPGRSARSSRIWLGHTTGAVINITPWTVINSRRMNPNLPNWLLELCRWLS
jgi:hypothetical protein